MSKEVKILLGIAVVVVVGGIFLFIKQPQTTAPTASVDPQYLVRDNSHMAGNKNAKVTLVEFGDYQCPGCGAAHPIVKRLLDDYKNSDFNFVFRNFPLTKIHPNAMISSEAAEAAAEQGKFWEMHDLLYEKQGEWSDSANALDLFVGYAGQLGLDTDKFKSAVQANKFADIITADVNGGTTLGVNSTPTFYVNGEKIDGYKYEVLKAKIEQKLE